jgi:hypothetical protein
MFMHWILLRDLSVAYQAPTELKKLIDSGESRSLYLIAENLPRAIYEADDAIRKRAQIISQQLRSEHRVRISVDIMENIPIKF